MMLAGLIKNVSQQELRGAPGLRSLPVLGMLFSSRNFQMNQTELVVIVTPYLARPVEEQQLATPLDTYNPPTDKQQIFLGRLNRIYGAPGDRPWAPITARSAISSSESLRTMPNSAPTFRRPPRRRALLLLLLAVLLAGCSQDFASADDRLCPSPPRIATPIRVTDKTAKMTVDARSGRVTPEQVNRVAGYAPPAAKRARARATAGSARARAVSAEATAILANQGVPRHMIQTASYNGKADVVTLSFTRRVATTDPLRRLAGKRGGEPI